MKIVLAQFYSKTPTPVYNELSSALTAVGHTVLVGTPDASGDLVWKEEGSVVATTTGPRHTAGMFSGIPLARGLIRRCRQLAFLTRVKRFLRQFDPDVVQVNRTMFSGYLPLFMPKHMFFVYDVRQPGLWGSKTLKGRIANARGLQKIRWNACIIYHTTCYASAMVAQRVHGPEWSRWGVIAPIGVDKRFLTHLLPPPGAVSGKRSFVYIGTIGRLRNLELLLDAATEVLKKSDAFTLTLVGPGDDRKYYEEKIRSLGLEGHVQLGEPVPYARIPETIVQHDIAVAYVPDVEDWQYQPTLKVLEYRALGMPVVASDNPPNREVVQHEVNGLLARNTPREFSAAMLRCIVDPGFFESLRSRARQMRSGRTWDDVANIHLTEVYPRATSASRGVGSNRP